MTFSWKFDTKKKGDAEVSGPFRERLLQHLDGLQLILVKTLDSYEDSLKYYVDALENSIEDSQSYLSQSDFIKFHQSTKKEAETQVWCSKRLKQSMYRTLIILIQFFFVSTVFKKDTRSRW